MTTIATTGDVLATTRARAKSAGTSGWDGSWSQTRLSFRLDAIPPTSEGQTRALVVAAALREALSRRLGVDAAQEMGVAVAPRLRSDGGRRMSLFFFDRASGGSGFSVTAEADLPGLLREAAAVLACPANCESDCPDCILRSDLQHERASLDRPGALDLLRNEVLPRLDPPETLRIFGVGTEVIVERAEASLLGQLLPGSTTRLALLLGGDVANWDLGDWPGARLLAQARRAGAETALVIPKWKLAPRGRWSR